MSLIVETPESEERQCLRLSNTVFMTVYIVTDEIEQEVLCQRLEAFANKSKKRFHLINYKDTVVNDFRGTCKVSDENGNSTHTIEKPDWIGEDPLWLQIINITDGLDDPDNARVKFTDLVRLLPTADREEGHSAVSLPPHSALRGVVSRDRVKDLKYLLDSLGSTTRSLVHATFIERNVEGYWQEMKS